MEGHSHIKLGYREARLVQKMLNHVRLGEIRPPVGEMTMQVAEQLRAKIEGFAGINDDTLVKTEE